LPLPVPRPARNTLDLSYEPLPAIPAYSALNRRFWEGVHPGRFICRRSSDSKIWIALRRGGAEKKTPRLCASARDIFSCYSVHKGKTNEGKNPNARSGHARCFTRTSPRRAPCQTARPGNGNTLLGDAKRQNRQPQSIAQARPQMKPAQRTIGMKPNVRSWTL